MATTIGNLAAILTLDARKYTSGVRKAEKDTRKFKKGLGDLRKTFNTLAIAAGGFIGGRAVFGRLNRAVELFVRQEDATRKLSAALRIVGRESALNLKDLKNFASEMQSLTRFGDEAIIEMMALGSALGRLSGQKLKDATRGAIGLSEAFNIELPAAMKIFGKAAQGEFGTLTEYGIMLDKTLSKHEKWNELMKIGAEGFSIAVASAKTAGGKMEQAVNQIGDQWERLGERIAPIKAEIMSFIPDVLSEGLGALGVPETTLDAGLRDIRKQRRALLFRSTGAGRLVTAMSGPITPDKRTEALQQRVVSTEEVVRTIKDAEKAVINALDPEATHNLPAFDMTDQVVTGNAMRFFDSLFEYRF